MHQWAPHDLNCFIESLHRGLQRFGLSLLPTQEMQVIDCMFPILFKRLSQESHCCFIYRV